MISNIESYKNDLEELIIQGAKLELSMRRECLGDDKEKLDESIKKKLGEEEGKKQIDKLPSFTNEYQTWYSEAHILIKQLLPNRLSDFMRHYEKQKSRKEITNENYRIEDYLQGLSLSRGYTNEVIVGPKAAIPHFRQQLAILEAAKKRFESSLFDIKQLAQADLFDSELEAAKELAKNKFTRGAGAVAGVVLERHLIQICENHNIKIKKKYPSISDLNDKLKEKEVIELPNWRFIQHLADIRNLCDHSKEDEPTLDQVNDLINGVSKIIKTIF